MPSASPSASPSRAPTRKCDQVGVYRVDGACSVDCVCKECLKGTHNPKRGELSVKKDCLDCPFPERCLGGIKGCLLKYDSSGDPCPDGGPRCDSVYSGDRCQFCREEKDGRKFYSYDDDCYLCPKVPWKLVAMGGLVIATVVAFSRYSMPHWTVVAAVKQFVSFAQNIVIINLVSIQWPKVFLSIMSAFKVAAFSLGDIATPECWGATWSWHDRFAMTTASFAGAGVLLAVFTRFARMWGWHAAEAKFKRVLLLLFTATYTTVPVNFLQNTFSDRTHCNCTATARMLIPAECSAVS